MSPEDEGFRQQSDIHRDLREQISTLDAIIANEGASLDNWKRVKAREWMDVLFDGLLDCNKRGSIIAAYGRIIIRYVSTEETQPGFSRPPYSGHSHVESLVARAEQKLNNLSINEDSNGTPHPSNQSAIPIPRNPPPASSSLIQPTLIQPAQPHSFLNKPPSNLCKPSNLSGHGPHLPVAAANTNSKQPKGQDNVTASLNLAIVATNLAKEVASATPAKAIFGTVCALLTMIRVCFLLPCDGVYQTHK